MLNNDEENKLKISTNEEVASLINMKDATEAMRQASLHFNHLGEMQARVRVGGGENLPDSRWSLHICGGTGLHR